jgi:hypothetical protein
MLTDSDNMSVDTEVAEVHFSSVKEAFMAGWKAKQKTNAERKARGFTDPSKSSSGGGKKKSFKKKSVKKEVVTVNPNTLRKSQPAGSDNRTIDERKKNSKCSDCKQKGHWGGDAECPLVKSGKVKLRVPGTKAKGTHMVELVTSSIEPAWVLFVEHAHVTELVTGDMIHDVVVDTEHEQYDKAFYCDTDSMNDCESFDMEYEYMLHDMMEELKTTIDKAKQIARRAVVDRGMMSQVDIISEEEQELIGFEMESVRPRPLWPPDDTEGKELGMIYSDADKPSDPYIVIRVDGDALDKVYLSEVPDCILHCILVDCTKKEEYKTFEFYRMSKELDYYEEISSWIEGALKEIHDHYKRTATGIR